MNLLFFLHDRVPEAVAFTIGPITIYWYGLIMALSIIAGLSLALAIAKRRGLASEIVYDAGVWIIIGGLIGARLYEGFLEWEFYSAAPLEIFKVWHGGLAIHGALIGGAIALYLFSRQKRIRTKFNFWNIAAVLVPGYAIGELLHATRLRSVHRWCHRRCSSRGTRSLRGRTGWRLRGPRW